MIDIWASKSLVPNPQRSHCKPASTLLPVASSLQHPCSNNVLRLFLYHVHCTTNTINQKEWHVATKRLTFKYRKGRNLEMHRILPLRDKSLIRHFFLKKLAYLLQNVQKTLNKIFSPYYSIFLISLESWKSYLQPSRPTEGYSRPLTHSAPPVL
jgi:hypothetical protein